MAITNAQQFKQLVNPPMKGKKRPGYRGDDAARASGARGASRDTSRADPGDAGRGDTRGDPGPADDRSSALQTYNQQVATGTQLPPQLQKPIELNKREQEFKNFLDRRNKVNLFGLGKFFTGPAQMFSDFNASINRPFFEKVIRAGKIPGLSFDMTEEELEDAYQDYMSERLSGNIDAYGNPLMGGEDRGPDNTILFPQDTTPGDGDDSEDEDGNTNRERGLAIRFRKDGGRINVMDGGRIGFRIGSDSGKDTSGRDYASDTAASRSVATSSNRDTGGGDNNQQTVTAPVKISKPVKDAANTAGELMFLRNVINLNPIGIMKNIGSKMIMDKLISEADTEDENMMLADVSAMDIKRKNQFKNLDYGTAKDIGMINPTMTQEEFEGVKSGEITEPTGQFAADGGRIGAMDGGMMSPEGGIMDLESGRQMYFLGKLVKKATRAVKKVVKSPIGKAALIGGLGFLGINNPAVSGFFKDKFMPFMFEGGNFNLSKLTGKGAMAGIGALSALPLLFGQQEEEEDQTIDRGPGLDINFIRNNPYNFLGPNFANGGRIGYQEGSKEPVAKKTMPLLDMGGKEMDLRDDGGFVPLGRMERADDVPARLSKNEFVFTADAVRNAGEGDVDKGAEVMYNMMKNLESGGEVSEESQGLSGAREMFQTSKRLEEVL